jgi:VIT1/CCC1 family predicted Fe2+/Mn2+ transporter
MSDWKRHLQDTIALIVGAVIFLVLLVVGIYLLSYVIIIVAVIGIIAFIAAQVSGWFGGKKKPKKMDNSGHRVINQDEPKDK